MNGPIFYSAPWGGHCWYWRGETVRNYATRLQAFEGWRAYRAEVEARTKYVPSTCQVRAKHASEFTKSGEVAATPPRREGYDAARPQGQVCGAW